MSVQQRLRGVPPSELTVRQRDIVARIGRGENHDTIATALGISRGGVSVQMHRLREKLGLPSTRHLALYAVEHGLTNTEST